MDLQIKDKKALVSGSSQGIGLPSPKRSQQKAHSLLLTAEVKPNWSQLKKKSCLNIRKHRLNI